MYCRLVANRASLTAPSTASVPELPRKTRHFSCDRSDAGQLGAHLGVDGQVEVGAVVDQLAGLVLDRGDDVGMAMAGRGDGDTGVEVEKEVAVDVLDRASLAPNRHDRIRSRHAGRSPLAVELEVSARSGAGQLGDEVRNSGGLDELAGSLGHGAPRHVYGGPRIGRSCRWDG